MANGTKSTPPTTELTDFLAHQEGRYAKLDERVTSISQRLNGFDDRIAGVITSVNNFAAEFRTQLSQLSQVAAEFRNSRAPQWQAISIGITVIIAIGGLAYWPIATSTADLKSAVAKLTDLQAQLVVSLPDKYVPRTENERISKWAEAQRQSMQDQLDKLYDKVDHLEDAVAEQKAKP